MPIVTVPLKDVEQTITRPVIQQIIEQVRVNTGLKDSMKIFYPGDTGIMQSQGSSITSDNNNKAVFEASEILFVEVTEVPDEEELGINPMTRKDVPPIFLDGDVGFMLRPTTQRYNYTVNFIYQSKSKTSVTRWRTSMLTKLQQDARQWLLSFQYGMTIPDEYKDLITNIHKNREEVDPYGETLGDYLKRYCSDQTTIIGNQAGEEKELVFTKKDTRVVGQFDFGAIPDEPSYDQGQGLWSISFPFKFNWQKPAEIAANYPIAVHNAMLPDRFVIPKSTHYANAGENFNTVRDGFVADMERFEMNTVMDVSARVGGHLRLPYFDDHSFPPSITSYSPVFSALCGLDPDDPTRIIDLANDLDDWRLDPIILDYLLSERDKIVRPYESVFYLNYHNWNFRNNSDIWMDGSIMRSRNPLSLRDSHRVVFDICTSFSRMPFRVIDKLRANPKVFVKVIAAANEILGKLPALAALADRREITRSDFNYVYALVMGLSTGNLTGSLRPYYIDVGVNASVSALNPPRSFPEIDLRQVQESLHLKRHTGCVIAFSHIVSK